MTCDDLADAIEAIAAGEQAPDADVTAHLAACASCTAGLEQARRLDRLLRGRAAPPAPAQFAARAMQRIRRARWRREQVVDGIFNAAMIATALLVAAGLWIALRHVGPSIVSHDAMDVFSLAVTAMAQRASPSVPLYAGATGLLVVALGLWWWAERDSLI